MAPKAESSERVVAPCDFTGTHFSSGGARFCSCTQQQLLKRESERKELLDPGDRERARRPLAAERRGPRALYVGMVFGWQEVSQLYRSLMLSV